MEAIRILVVEDDPDINQLLCTIMSDAGYQWPAGLLWQ